MKILKRLVLPLFIVIGLSGVLAPIPAGALDVYQPCSNLSGQDVDTTVCAGKSDSANSLLKNIVNTLLFIIGAVAVVMIIIAGLRYVVSAGNASAVKGAKDTLLYAIIGLVVAFVAYAIVNWVVQQF